MKINYTDFVKEYEILSETLLKIPVVNLCDHLHDNHDGFTAQLVFIDETRIHLDVIILKRAFPSIIRDVITKKNREPHKKTRYSLIIAPYISNESARQCERLNVGYLDMSGNCRLLIHSLYVSDQGHPNRFNRKRTAKNIFDPSSKVSSLILREIMRDPKRRWKLSLLSQTLGCSIGQVSKVKDYLCEQLWAHMGSNGLQVLDSMAIMHAWSEAYSQRSPLFEVVDCYTLLSVQEFEERVREIHMNSGIDSYFTGFSGGVRYAPVVRYNKIHLMVRAREMKAFLGLSGCKPVESGANIQIQVLSGDNLLLDAREINGYQVVSPIQIFLDCMRLKGRGEEMAEAILTWEIMSDQRQGAEYKH